MPTDIPPAGVADTAPVVWQVPAVDRLRQSLQREKTRYWLLVTIIALACAPLAWWLCVLVFELFPALGMAFSEASMPEWLQQFVAPFSIFSAGLGNMLSLAGLFAVPILVVIWALTTHNRQIKLATYDLVYGQLLLMLMDEQFSKLIEDERREHFRPSIMPVHVGTDFLSQLDYFATYYTVFRQLSLRPGNFKLPIATARNCWMDGSVACLSGCLNTCAGAGVFLTIPLVFRIVMTWSHQLAIKQAVLDVLSDRHDNALLEQHDAAVMSSIKLRLSGTSRCYNRYMEAESVTTHVLILCASDDTQELFKGLFEISGLSATIVRTPDDFLAHLAESKVDVALLAAGSEQPPAHDLLSIMRTATSPYRDLPVVMIYSAETPKETQLEGMHIGAYDYLVDPFNEIELLTKIAVLAKVKHAEDEFRELAITDRITGLYDNRYLFMRFGEELSRAKRYDKSISCAVIDLDNFTEVNQQYGTDAGDVLLQLTAKVLRMAKREIDVLARYEDDEFVLVLYNTDMTGSMVLLSRIQSKLLEIKCTFDRDYQVHSSIGLASVDAGRELTMHSQELLQRAQAAMKQAKKQGGGRIVMYSDELADDVPQQ